MKLSTIIPAVLGMINPVISQTDNTFTFTLLGPNGLSDSLGSITVNITSVVEAAKNATWVSSLPINITRQLPDFIDAAHPFTVHDPCNRECCLGICLIFSWVPIVGPACVAACAAVPK